ncbi:GNAT family N-acetyltransferase [bacterium]|nr:GNAT family N-acetyltransferase [bacterium]
MLIRRYKKGDAPKISEFINRCFIRHINYEIRSHAPDYYAWKYSSNPWGSPVVWVAEASDKIVGLMSVVPKQLWIDGEAWYCGESGDTFMDPDAKGKNVFLNIADHVFHDCHRAGMQMIYGTPNPVSYDIVTKLFGYEELFHYRSLVRPLRFGSLIRMKFNIPWISGLLGWQLNGMHKGVYWPRACNVRFNLESVQKPDERFDALWASMRSRIACSLVKNRSYIQWRFIDSPENFHVKLIKREDKPVGYVVFKYTPLQNVMCGHVADLTIPVNDTEWPGLWDCLLTELKSQNADLVNTWMVLDPHGTQKLRRFGFIMRKKPFWIVMRGEHKNVNSYPDIRDPLKWMFSQADTDNI